MNNYILFKVHLTDTSTMSWDWLNRTEAENITEAEQNFRAVGLMEPIHGPSYYIITMK